jgi:hypothetical protein
MHQGLRLTIATLLAVLGRSSGGDRDLRRQASPARGVSSVRLCMGSIRRSARIIGLVATVVLACAASTVSSVAVANTPRRDATVAGYVQVCGGPSPGGCFIETIGLCQAPEGCVTSDRVAAVGQAGRSVASQKLHHARFRLHLAPGRYTIELLGDGKHVHGRVMQRETVIARSYRTTVVRFFFAVP